MNVHSPTTSFDLAIHSLREILMYLENYTLSICKHLYYHVAKDLYVATNITDIDWCFLLFTCAMKCSKQILWWKWILELRGLGRDRNLSNWYILQCSYMHVTCIFMHYVHTSPCFLTSACIIFQFHIVSSYRDWHVTASGTIKETKDPDRRAQGELKPKDTPSWIQRAVLSC